MLPRTQFSSMKQGAKVHRSRTTMIASSTLADFRQCHAILLTLSHRKHILPSFQYVLVAIPVSAGVSELAKTAVHS